MNARQAAAALATMSVVFLAACSGGGEGAPASAAGEVDQPATGSIRFDSWTPTQDTMDAVVAGFSKENPDVEVTTSLAPYEDYQTSLQTQLRANEGPDIFVVEPGAMFHQFRQYMEPLDEYAATSAGEDWASDYREAALSRAQFDGDTYGLPIGYGVAGFLWVNKTVLSDAGVEVPTTYQELVSAAHRLTENGIAPVAMGAKDTWQDVDYYMALANAIDSEALYAALEGSGEWTASPLIEAFDSWKQLFTDGVFQEGAVGAATYNDTYDLFTQGKAGFFANGSWNLDMYINSLDKVREYEIDAIPLPTEAGPAPITGDVTGIVAVNKHSDNKAAAYRLVDYMSRGSGARTWMNAFLDFPVTSGQQEPGDLPAPAQQPRGSIATMIENRLAGYRQVPSPSVADELGQALIAVATGSASPDEAAQRVQDAADAA